MTLPDDYLRYPARRYGQDQDRYLWRAPADWPRPKAPKGKALCLSFIAPLEFFMLTPSGKPFKHPGAMQTAYPDLRHFTARDYGNRVGAYRILDALNAAGLKATFAINGALLGRVRPLIDAILADGHEIAAHGWDTDSIHWGGIAADQERAYVEKTRAAFSAIGLSPRIWMSPARQQSFTTPDLVRAAGFDICLDWEIDNTPIDLRTSAGPLTAFPVFNELDDRTLLTIKCHSEAEWRDQILEAIAQMKGEYDRHGAQCLGLTLTPYVIGQPFRIWALRDLLSAVAGDEAILCGGVASIIDAVK